jgi:hypothetical protein
MIFLDMPYSTQGKRIKILFLPTIELGVDSSLRYAAFGMTISNLRGEEKRGGGCAAASLLLCFFYKCLSFRGRNLMQ